MKISQNPTSWIVMHVNEVSGTRPCRFAVLELTSETVENLRRYIGIASGLKNDPLFLQLTYWFEPKGVPLHWFAFDREYAMDDYEEITENLDDDENSWYFVDFPDTSEIERMVNPGQDIVDMHTQIDSGGFFRFVGHGFFDGQTYRTSFVSFKHVGFAETF